MYGWKARLGIMPTMDDMVLEPELYAMAPDGVAIYTSRLVKPSNDTTVDAQLAAVHSVEKCVDELVLARPAVICFGSTSASFVGGVDYDSKIIEKIQARSKGIPGTTISTALVSAFRAFGSKRVSVVTPYIEELNVREKAFLEGHGLEVVSIKGMQLISSDDICNQEPEDIYRFALNNFDTSADTLVFSCTGLHTAPIMNQIELSLKIPVLSSNAVALWHMLRMAKVNEKILGFGKLLAEY